MKEEIKIKNRNCNEYHSNIFTDMKIKNVVLNTYCESYHIRRANDTIRNGVIVVTLVVFVFGVFTYVNTREGDNVRLESNSTNASSISSDVFDKLSRDNNLDTEVDLASFDF